MSEGKGRSAGKLVVCATPIGNLGDLTPRVADAMREADLVVAEDTRRARKLLSAAGVVRPRGTLVSYHRGVERSRDQLIVDALETGSTVVFVSDAGMPLVSDPGFELVSTCIERGIEVDCLPGASAVETALVVSGFSPTPYVFDGFVPRTSRQRRRFFEERKQEARTQVYFDSPSRIRATLSDLATVFGVDRRVAVCRELTKLHQEVWRGSAGDAVDAWSKSEVKGEIVLVVAGPALAEEEAGAGAEAAARELIADALAGGASTADAAASAATTGLSRSRRYALALELGRGK